MSLMYFVVAIDSDGEKHDQFVCANSNEEAFKFFKSHLAAQNIFIENEDVRSFEVPQEKQLGVIGWENIACSQMQDYLQ